MECMKFFFPEALSRLVMASGKKGLGSNQYYPWESFLAKNECIPYFSLPNEPSIWIASGNLCFFLF